jgi:tetratricopeptide (TPR) repeat protein
VNNPLAHHEDRLGLVRCNAESCEKRISELQRALQDNPDDQALHYQLGICCSGLCQTHSLVSADLAREHLQFAVKAQPETVGARQRASMLNFLAITYLHSSMLPEKARLLGAIDCHKKAAVLYLEEQDFREWARMQFNLGNAWCEVPEDDFPDKWDYAIHSYKQALLFRDGHSSANECAATLQNLGTAYRTRLRGDKSNNIKKAIGCYRRALRYWKASIEPEHWAALQNNLGNAYLSLPSADQTKACLRARQAICHFDLALRVRTEQRDPVDYAITRLNRAQACLLLGQAGSRYWLREAQDCLHDARATFLRSGMDEGEKLIEEIDELIWWASQGSAAAGNPPA